MAWRHEKAAVFGTRIRERCLFSLTISLFRAGKGEEARHQRPEDASVARQDYQAQDPCGLVAEVLAHSGAAGDHERPGNEKKPPSKGP